MSEGARQTNSRPQGSRIDPYFDQYAERARGMVASEIRALFAVTARPEIVSLAGGSPYVTALPLDVVGNMVGQLVASRGSVALQYCTAQGDAGLREKICEVMSLEGIHAHPDDVVVTVGSQQALDLITRIFVDPGDVILAEAPSYVGALGSFAAYQADVVHVAMDDEGLIPEALEESIQRLNAAGRRIKFLYTVPNYQNPAGVTLAADRRPRILEICQAAGLLIIEDNPYGLLGFDGEPMRSLRADDPEGVVYLGTFSKTFAPGVRVGWAAAPPAIRDKLVLAAESAVLCHSSFSQLTVGEYLATQPWREQVKDFRELYRQRRDAMLDALSAQMPDGCRWTVPAAVSTSGCSFPRGSTPRRCCRAPFPPGWPTSPVRASTRTATAPATSGSPTVSRRRTGSGKAYAGWRPSSKRKSTCAPPSAPCPHPVGRDQKLPAPATCKRRLYSDRTRSCCGARGRLVPRA